MIEWQASILRLLGSVPYQDNYHTYNQTLDKHSTVEANNYSKNQRNLNNFVVVRCLCLTSENHFAMIANILTKWLNRYICIINIQMRKHFIIIFYRGS